MSLMNGGGGALVILEEIEALKNRVKQLEEENKSISSTKPITEAPSGGKVQFFGANTNITIASGKIPTYSKGVYIPNNSGRDAILIAVDIVGGNKLITAIKSNNTWQSIKVI